MSRSSVSTVPALPAIEIESVLVVVALSQAPPFQWSAPPTTSSLPCEPDAIVAVASLEVAL
jgi:hypothetical protein